MPIPLAVLGIFLVIWIVSNVMRAMQEANPANRRANPRDNVNRLRRPNQGGEAKALNQNSNTDIDRFLSELNRLRGNPAPPPQPVEATRPAPTRIAPSEVARARPTERPQQAQRRPANPQPTSQPRRTAIDRPQSRRPAVLEVTPVAPLPVMTPAAPFPAAKPAPTVEPTTGPKMAARTVSPVLLELQRLLRDRQAGVGAAILLSEIIGKPKSQRR